MQKDSITNTPASMRLKMHHIGLQAKANLVNGIQTSKPKNKFSVTIFVK